MRNDFLNSQVVTEIAELAYTMWEMGWDEKNGGNMSYILSNEETSRIDMQSKQFMELVNIPENMIGKYLLITASGSNFRLIKEDVLHTLGVIKVEEQGYSIQWGFDEGNQPTSELYMHLLSHSARLKVDKTHRVVVHNHATEISEMTFVHPLTDKDFTRTLWGIITECIIVFPDGIGVLPWMVCGNEEIGQATAKKLADCRIVIWSYHGILATGNSLNDAFGLIETVNKAAKIYMHTFDKRITKGITSKQLSEVATYFNIHPREEFL
ncbi:MAG: rhamnulose-1-phosphate aldolase [Breznakia sp.]